MSRVHIVANLDECRELWSRHIPPENISDLWAVRECFHRHFNRRPSFLVAEDGRGVRGFLPLSWIEEKQGYGYFPGETWDGKTWLEQNRIPAADDAVLETLISHAPGRYHLRYLLYPEQAFLNRRVVDETGYLFLPPKYDFDIEKYFLEFSHKSAKRLKREVEALEERVVRYRYDDVGDFKHLTHLNLSRFEARSYFHDRRFLEGFRSLAQFLKDQGWLRMTTILINEEPVAVDMGVLYKGTYTLLAGGTHGDYPGIAKLINLHHMRRACAERFERVDFLCGEFSWKTQFHLTPRPLYLISNMVAAEMPHDAADFRSAANA